MSGHMSHPPLARRTSRSSGSQISCRTNRVEKPKSHQNSPRTMERRKTTTESKLYATLDDHYRMMFGVDSVDVDDERPQQSRPFSWHPSSTHFKPSQQTSYFEPQPEYTVSPRNSAHGSDFYSLSTRNSSYEPTISQSVTPSGYGAHRGSDESDYTWNQNSQNTPSYVHSAINTPNTEPLPWYLRQWAQKTQAEAMQTQNGSSDFLPIQHPAAQDHDMEDDSGEKLVALGLYDLPESTTSWTGFTEGTGKGLKLEETWQPPEGDDEEEEEDADDASSAASMEEPSPPLPAVDEKTQQLQLPVQNKSQNPGSMEGQSFFFDDEESVNKEWWYQQLKQPQVAMRGNGLGYGWL